MRINASGKRELVRSFRTGTFDALYESLGEKEKEEIRRYEKFQEKLKNKIEPFLDQRKEIPQAYVDLANIEWFKNDETFQKKLREALGFFAMSKDIFQQYLKFVNIEWAKEDIVFQEKLKFEIGRLVGSGVDIRQEYFSLASEETLQWLKSDAFQEKLRIGIETCVENRWDILQQYLKLANEETLQEGLKIGIIERVDGRKSISQQYLDPASEETIKWFKENEEFQKKLLRIGKTHLKQGFSLGNYDKLMNETTKRELFSSLERSEREEFATTLIISFFNNSEKVRATVEQLIKEKTNEEIEQILFDKTELPMGIKLHTEEGSPYGNFLNSTGGFIAHGQDTTWVANPLPNQKATELAFEVLEKLKKESGYEGDYGYIQTTFPKRLNNEYASIATIVHMFTKEYFETNEGIDQLITHNQDTKGITIYDAGRVITNKYTIPNEKGEVTIPSWEGRTDVLLSDTLNDVKNIRTVMTLLVHASEEYLAFSSLGKQFIQEVKDILNTSSHINVDEVSKNITFVGDGVDPQELGSFLSQIAAMREDLKQRYANYKRGRSYLNSLEEGTGDYTLALKELERLHHELTSHPSIKLRELITSYREKMFSKGYFHELYGWMGEHEVKKQEEAYEDFLRRIDEQLRNLGDDDIFLN